MSIETTLRDHEKELLALPGVTSVGIGHEAGKEVILVFVRTNDAVGVVDEDAVPTSLDGYDVAVRPAMRIGGAEPT